MNPEIRYNHSPELIYSWQDPGNPILDGLARKNLSFFDALIDQVSLTQNYLLSLTRYMTDFLVPLQVSMNYFNGVEQEKVRETPLMETVQSYMELMDFTMDLSKRGICSTGHIVNDYCAHEFKNVLQAALNTLFNVEGEENLENLIKRQSRMMRMVAHDYPRAIADVESDYGFHFEKGNGKAVAETDRFFLYKVFPNEKGVVTREDSKPVVIIPPYVLGYNILGFLPGEGRSYAHSFANQGIPTYIRVIKDIATADAVQSMTGEDDALDTRIFCRRVKEIHGRPVTLNGYCQGGFVAVCNLLSGKLDGLVDALITCVAPMDGSKSRSIAAFLKRLPRRFNDLSYGSKRLSNGNTVADGDLMSWIYKLKSIEREYPLVALYRDMMIFNQSIDRRLNISKTAAALNFWLKRERCDLPMAITEMSFLSYNRPVSEDGTLPVRLFGKKLNFKRLARRNIKWLICYGESDDLVEKESALAPLDHVYAEVTPFPKGHIAIATSWSNPESECALHTRFGESNYRGPVRFHLDLDTEDKGARDKDTAPDATGNIINFRVKP
jgi:hypothetical protein